MLTKLKSEWNRFWCTPLTGEKLFFFAYTISLFCSFIINTTFMQYIPVRYLNWLNYLMILILILKVVVFDHLMPKQLLLSGLLLMLAIYSWRKTNLTLLMVMVAYILAAKGISFLKIVKRYFDINFVMIVGVSLYSLLGIIRNLGFERDGFIRHSMGVDYPTDFAAYVLYLTVAYLFLNYSRLNYFHYIGVIVLAVCLNLITNARLDVYMLLISLIVIWIAKRADDPQNLIARTTVSAFWSLSIILPYGYFLLTEFFDPQNKIFTQLNRILSGRLLYGHLALDRYGLTIFGQRVIEHGWGGVEGLEQFRNARFKYFFIDSTFIRLFVIYGAVLGIFIISVLVIISVRETLKHNYVFPAIILIITISSLIDQHLLEITFNPFLLALLANTNKNNPEERLNNEKAVQS